MKSHHQHHRSSSSPNIFKDLFSPISKPSPIQLSPKVFNFEEDPYNLEQQCFDFNQKNFSNSLHNSGDIDDFEENENASNRNNKNLNRKINNEPNDNKVKEFRNNEKICLKLNASDIYTRLDNIKIDNSPCSDKGSTESENTAVHRPFKKKQNISCFGFHAMVEKSANFSIICKDFVFHGEMQKNKSEFFKIEEKEIKDQSIKIMAIWKKVAPIIRNFSLKINSIDIIPEDFLKVFTQIISLIKTPSKASSYGLYLTSKCEEKLLWSAPEFVFKTFLEPLTKASQEYQIVFKLDHIFQKYIDRGINLENLETILDSFIRKFPLIELTSLHLKLMSWMNLNDIAISSLFKVLALYGKSISDLELIFSGAGISDFGIKALNTEICHSIGKQEKIRSLALGFDCRNNLATDLGFIDICETLLKLSQKNFITKVKIMMTSKEISGISLEVLNFTMAKLKGKITEFTLFLAGQLKIQDEGLKDFLRDFFEKNEHLELLNIGFLGPMINKKGFDYLFQSLALIKSKKLHTLRVFYHGKKERSVDLENEYRKIICSSCPDLKQISINIFLKEKYSEKISFL